LFNQLRSLLPRIPSKSAKAIADPATLAPGRLLLVVGDIHGSYEALNAAVQRIEKFVTADPVMTDLNPLVICVGDYVDRGERSADVLMFLFDLAVYRSDMVECLMGNHERMMLDFLDDPVGRGGRWLRNGGLQTLASFGVGGIHERSDAESLTAASQDFEAAMPEGMLEWLRGLPLKYNSGNVWVTHAAMDPYLDPEDQSSNVLLWGHKDFMTTPREDDLWVVHGHTIVRDPQFAASRISVDTGAYATGRLTVAAILPGHCEFL
jgi:serine/threonine protein phosphatase 1